MLCPVVALGQTTKSTPLYCTLQVNFPAGKFPCMSDPFRFMHYIHHLSYIRLFVHQWMFLPHGPIHNKGVKDTPPPPPSPKTAKRQNMSPPCTVWSKIYVRQVREKHSFVVMTSWRVLTSWKRAMPWFWLWSSSCCFLQCSCLGDWRHMVISSVQANILLLLGRILWL